jgi:hypothetical protein
MKMREGCGVLADMSCWQHAGTATWCGPTDYTDVTTGQLWQSKAFFTGAGFTAAVYGGAIANAPTPLRTIYGAECVRGNFQATFTGGALVCFTCTNSPDIRPKAYGQSQHAMPDAALILHWAGRLPITVASAVAGKLPLATSHLVGEASIQVPFKPHRLWSVLA